MSILTDLHSIMGSDGLSLFLFFGLFGGMALLGSTVFMITSSWQRVQELREEADLKRDLLARGMSVDDAVKLLQATRGAADPAVREVRGAWRNPWAQAWGWGCHHRRGKC